MYQLKNPGVMMKGQWNEQLQPKWNTIISKIHKKAKP